MRQLDNKVFDIIDAWCNHEGKEKNVHWLMAFNLSQQILMTDKLLPGLSISVKCYRKTFYEEINQLNSNTY